MRACLGRRPEPAMEITVKKLTMALAVFLAIGLVGCSGAKYKNVFRNLAYPAAAAFPDRWRLSARTAQLNHVSEGSIRISPDERANRYSGFW
jgi:hypothetical protein